MTIEWKSDYGVATCPNKVCGETHYVHPGTRGQRCMICDTFFTY